MCVVNNEVVHFCVKLNSAAAAAREGALSLSISINGVRLDILEIRFGVVCLFHEQYFSRLLKGL